MRTLYIDLETRSRVNLKRSNVYRYAEDADFRVLMAAWSVDGGPVQLAVGEDEVDAIPGLWDPTVRKIAHNAQFERVCLTILYWRRRGIAWVGAARPFMSPEEWHDPQAVAGERGYPQKLATLARWLGGEQKDEAGTRLINLFSKPNREGGWNDATTHPQEWAQFEAYCVQDVATLIDVDRALGDWPTAFEREVWIVDQYINDRGVALDVDTVRWGVHEAAGNRMAAELEISRLTGLPRPTTPQLTAWLKREGLALPNMRAKTIELALAGQPMPAERKPGEKAAKVFPPVELNARHRRVLTLHSETAAASTAKYGAALQHVSRDGRLRGQFAFFGAHTGRWAGRGVQLHNMPRESLADDEAVAAALFDLTAGFGADPRTLKALVRSMLTGPFTVVDYAAIEARVIAWLAGESWALEAFARGRDIYVETADRMSTPGNRLGRSQGKVAVLALGYNGGVGSLRAMGAEGTDRELQRLVGQWRSANPAIVELWREMGTAFRIGGTIGAGLVTVEVDGRDRAVRLPSGRAIEYHGVRHGWETTDSGERRLVASFRDPGTGYTQRTYGGRLCENVTQAVARDVLAVGLVRLHRAGYAVVGHVHDEVIVEGSDVEGVRARLIETPEWAAGLPLDGAGFVCPRYRKG